MKKHLNTFINLLSLLFFITLFLNSCKPEEIISEAIVETSEVKFITEATATCGGMITSDGGAIVEGRGVCWSISPNPTIENSKTSDAAGTGAFTSSITGLAPGTTYYVRAYATNKAGTGYGLQITFKTKSFALTTTPISFLSATSAICGGTIASDGDSLTVTARGVCWNTMPNPKISNSLTTDGHGAGSFTSLITKLEPLTNYFVRSYATNSVGTIYGDEVSFTTLSGVIGLTTTTVSSITAYTATSGGKISSDGGATITARGICWNTSSEPTIENFKTTSGSGTGTFTSGITGLTPGTTYYIRAYATNSVGTGYGDEKSFITQSGVVGLTTTAASSITAFTATSGGIITSDGGATITERGICWNTSPSPTIANNKTAKGSGMGSYTSEMSGLTPGIIYYVRAYAINSVGTGYGNEVNFTTLDCVTDIDGNVYNTVTIGTQVWMIENLKTTRYNDGTSIPLVSGTTWSNLSTPGYCFYNNDVANKNKYGALYNLYTVNTGKLAPTGWHVPTDAEWTTLENYLIANGYNYDGTTTGNKIAKSLAATTDWVSYTATGTIGNDLTKNNSSGFTALPGGYRTIGGSFYYIGNNGFWWSSTEGDTAGAWFRYLYNYYYYLGRDISTKSYGFSVRCLRDY